MTNSPTEMKTKIFHTLLFVAFSIASLDGASDDDGTGMCPKEYFRKHPEIHSKKKELMKKYGLPDFSKLKSCSSDGKCDKSMKCCQTPCGMKCIRPIFENNALETLEQIQKEIGFGPNDKAYVVTEEDKKYGMCPENYIKTHPEVKEKMREWKQKHSHDGSKHGEQCHQKDSNCKNHKHFKNFTAMADCSSDADCSNNMRCCNTICGRKCVKPVFTNEDLKESLFRKGEENRKKREVNNEDEQDMGNDNENKESMDHEEASGDGDTGICPGEYLRKHPEFFGKKKDLIKKYGPPDFSKLKSCSSDGKCDEGMKCCQTPCGMKCMRPVVESNAWETLEEIHKEIARGLDDKPYVVTEEDKKYGMCPENYIKTHPEVKEKIEKRWEQEHSCGDCKHSEQCFQKHSHCKKHQHFRNHTATVDCSSDADCSNNMRCCNTMCGRKCVKPVFTNKDLKESLFGKDEENRKHSKVNNEDEEGMDHDNEMEDSIDHEGASDNDDDTGICPGDFMRKHPQFLKKKKDLVKKYGLPDFSKLKSCSSDGKCDEGMKCCQTPCGMKCMRPVFESNAWETMEEMIKEITSEVDDKPYVVTEEDKKYGMCPENYVKIHPEVKENFVKSLEEKFSCEECKRSEHFQCKKHKHIRNHTAMADCSSDADCSNSMRCCNTMCGKKCVKPVFTNEDLKESLFIKDEEKENRKKRDLNYEDEQDIGRGNEMEHRKDHGKRSHGKGNRKGGGKSQGNGGDHGKCKGGECGEGHGKGEEHGKGQKKGNRKGAGNGKGRGKGQKHGKGHGNAQEHDVQ